MTKQPIDTVEARPGVQPDPVSPLPEPSRSPLEGAWALFLPLCLAAGLAYSFGHALLVNAPGIGFTLSWAALTGAFLFHARREGKLRLRGDAAALLVLSALLALSLGLRGFGSIRWMNAPLTLLTGAAALGAATGRYGESSPLSGEGLRAVFGGCLPACFRHWGSCGRLISRRMDRQRMRRTGIGLLIAAPAALTAFALLMSADSAFAGRFRTAPSLDVLLLMWRLGFGLFLALCCFSALSTVMEKRAGTEEARKGRLPQLYFLPALFSLSALYAVYLFVRARTLMGLEGEPPGGWAEYARSGFFQMVLVALISLTVCHFALRASGGAAVRVFAFVTLLLTGGILGMAISGLWLYMDAYGLTVLRGAAAWGMAMTASALIAFLLRCVRPGLRVCRPLAYLALVSWLVLTLAAPERLVARSQIARFEAGLTESLDAGYLIRLSPAVRPELEAIRDKTTREAVLQEAGEAWRTHGPGWYDWSADWLGRGE